MKTIFCKELQTYTNKCNNDCDCPEYSKQGIGSLIENGVSNINNTSSPRTTISDRAGLPD